MEDRKTGSHTHRIDSPVTALPLREVMGRIVQLNNADNVFGGLVHQHKVHRHVVDFVSDHALCPAFEVTGYLGVDSQERTEANLRHDMEVTAKPAAQVLEVAILKVSDQTLFARKSVLADHAGKIAVELFVLEVLFLWRQ